MAVRAEAAPLARAERDTARWALRNGAHLAALSGFALAQPLLDILGRNAEFFAVRGSSPTDIVLFAAGLILLPPAVLLALELTARAASRRLADLLHLVLVAALVAVVLLHALVSADVVAGAAAVGAAAVAGAAGALLYRRARVVRSLLSVLAPAPLVFALLFLFGSPVSKLVFVGTPDVQAATVRATTPVVLIVFDELSTVSLMDRRQRIDARRYPGFGALAKTSTWYRDATTGSWLSEIAVPSVLTGQVPKPGTLPIHSEYPRSIFTLLGDGYEMRVVESLSQICPPSLCRTARPAQTLAVRDSTRSLLSDAGTVYLHLVLPRPFVDRVPPIADTWGNFGGHGAEEEQVRRGRSGEILPCGRNVCQFLDLIAPARRPTLHLLHTLLPHVPYVYLPSGHRYAVEAPVLRGQRRDGLWSDPEGARESRQRYLLQLAHTDRALDLLLRRLKEADLFDRALVVVTADHGVSFRLGQPRRLPTPGNLDDIAFVPLFVKLPGQRQGRIVDGMARTIDVVPTIARAIGVRPRWQLDGRPLVGSRPAKDGTVWVARSKKRRVTARLSELRRMRAQEARRQAAEFGNGALAGIYRAGPYAALVGRPVAGLTVRRSPAGSVQLAGLPLLNGVDPSSGFLPAYVQGSVRGSAPVLALAVNGKIAAVTRAYGQGGGTRFGALVPEGMLRAGRNEVAVYAVRGRGAGVVLEQLRGVEAGRSLAEQGGRTLIRARSQPAVQVRPGALGGMVRVERRGGVYVFTGWAGDTRAGKPAQTFVLFAGGREVFASKADLVRPHRVLGDASAPRKNFGFSFELPASVLPAAGSGQRVRLFAIRGDAASELAYPGGWPWASP